MAMDRPSNAAKVQASGRLLVPTTNTVKTFDANARNVCTKEAQGRKKISRSTLGAFGAQATTLITSRRGAR